GGSSETPEAEGGPGDIGRNGLEPPLHRCDEGECALGTDQDIQLVARRGVAVECVAARVLAGLGEACPDEPVLFRGQREPRRAPSSSRNAHCLPICTDVLHGLYPRPHAATAARAQAGGAGGYNAVTGTGS